MTDDTKACALRGARTLTRLLGTMAVLLLAGTGLAQQLASLMPPGSLMAVEVRQGGVLGQATLDELNELDWEGALAVLEQAFESVDGAETVSGMLDLFGATSGLDDTFSFCPALAPYFEYEEGKPVFGHYLMSVGFAPFNPIPAVNMVAAGFDAELVDTMLSELLACAATTSGVEVMESEQDGTAITTVTIDYDFSVSFARTEGALILSTNPDQVRYAVRLAGGSDEPSLADSASMQTDPVFEEGQFEMQWMVDFTVLSDLVSVFGGEFGPEAAPLIERVNAMLLTLGSVRGNIAVQPTGLLFESVMYPDSTGGDAALFDLLTGSGITLGSTPILPAGSVGVSSTTFDLSAGVNYLQGWLDTVGELIGEQIDLRATLLEMFGFDLDAELLGWLGNEVHVLQLDHSLQGLDSIYPGAGVAFVLPVASGEAAFSGLSALNSRIHDAMTMIAELEGADGLEMAVVRGEYRGHAFERVLAGPISDLGAAALGDNLVITMPAAALRGVIDTWLDSEAEPVPFVPTSGNLTAVTWYDTAGELHAAAGFMDLLVQPLAYAARLSLLEERDRIEHGVGSGGFDDWDWDAQDWSDGYVYGERDVSGIEYSVVGPGTHEGVITAAPDASSYATYFLLEGIMPGQEFTVSQTSTEMDSYLNLIELETGSVVAYNDDYGGTRDSTIIYTAAEGVTYLVEATTWSDTGTGAFVLEVSVSGGTDDVAAEETDPAADLPPVPSFAELVNVGERFPAFVRIIAERSGPAYGHTEIIGDTIRSRMFYTFDW